MDEHICRFNADTDDSSQQPHHGVWPGLRLLFQSFRTSILDFLDLADDEAQPRYIALQLRRDIWRQGRALRGVERCKTLRRLALPIRSPIDERTREGDDHPARLFLRLITDRGEKRAMEVIWGNRLKPGDYKYIGSFPHCVANAGDDWVGRWLDEKIDLARVYAEIWKDAAPAHLIDVALFCDSDDTHTASISYFAYVRLERR